MERNTYKIGKELLITSNEEIKKDEYYLGEDNNIYCLVTTVNFNGKKIILTTDLDLIKDGVQAIDDKFLEWFVKNPSCEEVEVVKRPKGLKEVLRPLEGDIYKIIIPKTRQQVIDEDFAGGLDMGQINPKEEPKQETLKEVCARLLNFNELDGFRDHFHKQELYVAFIVGIKYQQERSYSEKEVLNLILRSGKLPFENDGERIEWFEQAKKK